MSVYDKVQPYVSSEDGEIFELSFNVDEVQFAIIELTYQEITELLSSVADQVSLICESYQSCKER